MYIYMVCNVNKIEEKDTLIDTLIHRNDFLAAVDGVRDKMRIAFEKPAAGDTMHYIIRCDPEVRVVIHQHHDKLRLK